jgi:hypothetical protein
VDDVGSIFSGLGSTLLKELIAKAGGEIPSNSSNSFAKR